MRVLHVFKTYLSDSVGGVEKVIQQICLGTAARGVQNIIFSLTSNAEPSVEYLPEAELHRCPITFEVASTPFSGKAFSYFKKLAASVDIVNYHFPWPFVDLLHFYARHGKPTVLTYHSDIVRQKVAFYFYQPLMHAFLKQMNTLVAASPQYLQSSPVLQRYQKKTKVIPIGLEEKTYPEVSPENLEKWRAKLGENFFLFVGVLRYYKGLHILLQASKNIDAPVVIVGSGPMEETLKSQAQALKLSNVHFLGKVSEADKVALLTLCLAIVFPSHLRSEAFGVSLLEGAMFGKALISTELGTGTSFINESGKTGIVVPPGNISAFARAMQSLLTEKDKTLEMGKASRARFLEIFTADRMAEKYFTLYQDLMRKPVCSG